MKTYLKFFFLTLLVLIFTSVVLPIHVHAADPKPYTLLAELPLAGGSATQKTADLNTYIPNVVKLAIGIAGALAVLRIIFGGIQYMTTEAFDGKKEAKDTINNAVIGLLLALSAYIILYTLNPKLVEFDFSIAGLRAGAPISTDLGSITPETIDPIGATGCSSCAPMPGQSVIPHKTPAENGCKNPPGGECVLSAPLMLKLTRLNIAAKKLNPQITWQVTEMFPPTVPHKDDCHKPGPDAGTCADAVIFAPTTNRIIQFLTIMEASGITNYVYEKCPQEAANKLILALALTKFGSKIKCYETTTGESLHINK